jgi:hypothetical protein
VLLLLHTHQERGDVDHLALDTAPNHPIQSAIANASTLSRLFRQPKAGFATAIWRKIKEPAVSCVRLPTRSQLPTRSERYPTPPHPLPSSDSHA